MKVITFITKLLLIFFPSMLNLFPFFLLLFHCCRVLACYTSSNVSAICSYFMFAFEIIFLMHILK